VFVIATVILSSLLSAGPQKAPFVDRIVAATNVRLRSEPQTNAAILAGLSLGTVLTSLEVSADGTWYRVRTPDGMSGWVLAALTRPFSDRESTDVYRGIIESRLKTDILSFPEASELFQFVDRIAPQVQGPARAEFDLFRLRALGRSLDQIMGYEPTEPAHRDWIKKYEQYVVYSEPAGQWLVRAELYWELEVQHRGNPVADEIAWQAATTGLPGECEGYIPCHLAIVLLTDGRYLDRYPFGSHAAEAVQRIDDLLLDVVKPNTPYFMDAKEAAELRLSLENLAQILGRSSSPKKTDMLARLKQIEQTFAK